MEKNNINMKIKLFILLSCLSTSLLAQEKQAFFSWSAGAEEMNLAFVDLEVLADGTTIALAYSGGSAYGGKFLNSHGGVLESALGSNGGSLLLAFAPNGQLKWSYTLRKAYGRLYQISISPKGHILCLADVMPNDENDYYKSYEEEDDERKAEEEDTRGELPAFGLKWIDAGMLIMELNEKGQVLNHYLSLIHISEPTRPY